jgi:hypothetical protein
MATPFLPVACETPLSPAYQLTEPRILAIRSSPPDVPATGTVVLDALVYTPTGSAAPTYEWSWCASVDATLGCATEADALTSLLDPDGAAGIAINYSLGTGAQATFSFPATAAVIQAACARRRSLGMGDASVDSGDAGDSGDGGGDADVTESADAATDGGAGGGLSCGSDSLTVDILLTVDVGGTKLQAVREISLDFTTPTTVNTNPTIDGLAPFDALGSITDAGPLADALAAVDGGVADATVGVSSSGVVTLAADVPVTATDLSTQDRPPNGQDGGVCIPAGDLSDDASMADAGDAQHGGAGGDVRDAGACVVVAGATYESLSIAWYVENGALAADTTTMPATEFGAPQDWSAALLNTWTPPAGHASTQIILVARDNRGGVGWLRKTVTQ